MDKSPRHFFVLDGEQGEVFVRCQICNDYQSVSTLDAAQDWSMDHEGRDAEARAVLAEARATVYREMYPD